MPLCFKYCYLKLLFLVTFNIQSEIGILCYLVNVVNVGCINSYITEFKGGILVTIVLNNKYSSYWLLFIDYICKFQLCFTVLFSIQKILIWAYTFRSLITMYNKKYLAAYIPRYIWNFQVFFFFVNWNNFIINVIVIIFKEATKIYFMEVSSQKTKHDNSFKWKCDTVCKEWLLEYFALVGLMPNCSCQHWL